MMIDISRLLADAAAKVIDPENLQPKIEKALDEAITKAIGDAMGYNSDFRKLLNQSVADAMPKNIDGLVVMGELITDRIKEIVGVQQQNVLSQLIDKQLGELMGNAPESMKLSDLCRELTERWGRRDYDGPSGSRPTFIKETSSYGSVSFYMDKDEGKDKRECDFDLHLSADGGNILSLRIRGEDLKTADKRISRRWNDELYLTRLFAAGTKFEMDISEGEHHEHYYHED